MRLYHAHDFDRRPVTGERDDVHREGVGVTVELSRPENRVHAGYVWSPNIAPSNPDLISFPRAKRENGRREIDPTDRERFEVSTSAGHDDIHGVGKILHQNRFRHRALRKRGWSTSFVAIPTLLLIEWLYPSLFPTYLSNSGDLLAGQTIQNLVPALTANDYYYLTAGTGDTAGTYTAGQYLLTTYGHAVLA